jgi:hypothetical protein
MLSDLKNAAQAGTGSLWELGMIYFALGDQDESLRLMNGTLEKREFNGRLLKFDPLFDRMRADHH